ncbi:MAG TPA: ATP-binding protein [Terriglobales bacterium]|nr:ATP-binding protein [Terriglobales bacterium]
MKLKTKLTLGISLLVLLVVLAVNLIYLARVVQQRVQEVYTHADFLADEIYNEMKQELSASYASGQLRSRDPATLQQFLQSLNSSPAIANLFSSSIGYNNTIRDVALVAPDGVIAADSNPELVGTIQPNRRLLSDVMHSGLWEQGKAVFGADAIYSVSLATEADNHPMGTISVGVDTVLLRLAMLGEIRQLALYGGLVVLFATILAWSLAESILAPLGRIRAQLDALAPEAASATASLVRREGQRDEFGIVSSKIQYLGREMADVRQVYSTLQENVSHVLESLEEGLLLFDASGQSVMASAATPRLLGLPAGDIAGRPVEALFPGPSGLDRAVRLAVRQKVALTSRETDRLPGGRPILARLDLVRDRSGQFGSLLTLRDAEPVYRLENELEVARRLSAVGRLTRGVAHEVKNPLNAMAIHLDLLREKAGAEATGLQPHIEIMRREIDRLDRVVRTFLDFSRPVELNLQVGDLSEMVQSVAQLVQAGAAAKGIDVEVRAPAPGPNVWLDRDLVEQALLNLVNNGLQAMEAAAGPGILQLEVFEQDHYGLIRVRDQGPGVPVEDREKIFDLYFTTRTEGTGIGLALAARIMQLHHGAIELEPSAPPGASFVLRFPLRTGEDAV